MCFEPAAVEQQFALDYEVLARGDGVEGAGRCVDQGIGLARFHLVPTGMLSWSNRVTQIRLSGFSNMSVTSSARSSFPIRSPRQRVITPQLLTPISPELLKKPSGFDMSYPCC